MCKHDVLRSISLQENPFFLMGPILDSSAVLSVHKIYECDIISRSPALNEKISDALNELIDGFMGRGSNQFLTLY